MNDKFYSFLGLATKAGKTVTGEDICERMIKRKALRLVIIAEDASENTLKKFTDLCSSTKTDYRVIGSKEMLGKYTGKSLRAICGVFDRNFSQQLIRIIDGKNS